MRPLEIPNGTTTIDGVRSAKDSTPQSRRGAARDRLWSLIDSARRGAGNDPRQTQEASQGETLDAVIMAKFKLDALVRKAAAGEVDAMAAAGIRILFNRERPSGPIAGDAGKEPLAAPSKSDSQGAGADLDRMGWVRRGSSCARVHLCMQCKVERMS